MATVREAAIEFFRAHGLTTVFGNPGSTELPMLTDFPDDFRYVLGLQEAAVVGMADGYAQATGRPALVNLHTAPGVGNAMGAIVNARSNGSPLLITAGQQVRPQMNLEALLTNPRAASVPEPLVKFSAEPPRAQDVPAVLARALHLARTPPTGPVFVSIPMDDWTAPADDASAVPVTRRHVTTRTLAHPEGVDEIVTALEGAEEAALVIGGDVDATGGFDAAVALAEHLRTPVYGPPAGGRAGFPWTHPQYLGPLPQAIAPLARELEPYDVVVVLGAPVFRYYPYVPGEFLPGGTRLLHVTTDPDEAARAPVGDAVLGDPTAVIRTLLERLPASGRTPTQRPTVPAPRPGADGVLSADEVFAVVGETWPEGAVFLDESPSNLAAAQARVPVDRPGSYFFTASGGLGFALPAAVGVALADPSRPVVAAIGDGSMQYSIQALATAAAHAADLTVIVLDNREYAILKWFAARENTPKAPGLDLPPIDHVGLAAAYGVPARTASTVDELRTALGRRERGPRLVHVPIAPSGS